MEIYQTIGQSIQLGWLSLVVCICCWLIIRELRKIREALEAPEAKPAVT